MRKTLSLSPRTHLFIKDSALFIKLQRPHSLDPMKADYYIIKKFSINRLKEIRDWADAMIQASESSNVKKD